MTEQPAITKPTKRKRKPQNYVHHVNAICLTLYSPDGSTVPAKVRNEALDALTEIALRSDCLIGVATT